MNPNPYAWQELWQKWEREQLTNEQLLGQLVVWGQLMYTQLVTLQRQVEGRQRLLDEMLARLTEVEKRAAQR